MHTIPSNAASVRDTTHAATEASTAGLPPGYFPAAVQFDGRAYSRGRVDRCEGEVCGVWYSGPAGYTLLIIND